MIILHGVTGHAHENYMEDMAYRASSDGYNVVVFNHFAPHGENDMKMIDFGDNSYFDKVIEFAKKQYQGAYPPEIYLVGFSLGGNFALRFIGDACKSKSEGKQSSTEADSIKAIAAISNPFDVLHTGVKLKHTRWGLYNKFLYFTLSRPFFKEAFFD